MDPHDDRGQRSKFTPSQVVHLKWLWLWRTNPTFERCGYGSLARERRHDCSQDGSCCIPRPYVLVLRQYKPVILIRVLGLAKFRITGKKLPKGLLHETINLIFQMCTQGEPFNYSSQLYEMTSEFPSIYKSLIATKPALPDLMVFARRLPDPRSLAAEVRRVFGYLNNYFVRNSENPSVEANVLKSCRELKWKNRSLWECFAETIVEESQKVVETDPILVQNAIQELRRLTPEASFNDLPDATKSSIEKVRVQAAALTIKSGADIYSGKAGVEQIPIDLCELIAKFSG